MTTRKTQGPAGRGFASRSKGLGCLRSPLLERWATPHRVIPSPHLDHIEFLARFASCGDHTSLVANVAASHSISGKRGILWRESPWVWWRLCCPKLPGVWGLGSYGSGGSGVESFVEGDGFLAAGAEPAGADGAHEGVAFFAALDAEVAGVAVVAVVDGVGFAGLPGGPGGAVVGGWWRRRQSV